MRRLLDGNASASHGARLARVEVVSAYPITPSTTITTNLAQYISAGQLKAEFIAIEGEHSAIVGCMGAAMGGARAFTATAGQGLAYMHEGLHYVSGCRLPVVMAVVNRAIAVPWSNLNDHQITVGQRDTGWLQLHCETPQEILDTIIQAYRIAEDPRVLLPIMVCLDGWNLSYLSGPVDIPEQEEVDKFLPAFVNTHCLLDPADPKTVAGGADAQGYILHRYDAEQAAQQAKAVIREVDLEFASRFGRSSGGLAERYCCDGAEVVIVAMGAAASTARDVVDGLRAAGTKAGLLRIRSYRPFPTEEIQEVAAATRALCVIDRHISFGCGGALHAEVRSAAYDLPQRPAIAGFIAGLGGKDITPEHIEWMVRRSLASTADAQTAPQWILREVENELVR